jgi:hypothetical protein
MWGMRSIRKNWLVTIECEVRRSDSLELLFSAVNSAAEVL